jgi:hypothetical protein
MDLAGPVRALKEADLPPIRTVVWTFLDGSRPNLQRRGAKRVALAKIRYSTNADTKDRPSELVKERHY